MRASCQGSARKCPDTERNRVRFGVSERHGYPVLELMTLVENGLRA
ncbi:hypothetical protein [Nocardiopsis nanhaiensis]